MNIRLYVLEGPKTIGNVFGYYGTFLPEGRFAVVYDDQYTNGGCGPTAWDGKAYASREAAEASTDKET